MIPFPTFLSIPFLHIPFFLSFSLITYLQSFLPLPPFYFYLLSLLSFIPSSFLFLPFVPFIFHSLSVLSASLSSPFILYLHPDFPPSAYVTDLLIIYYHLHTFQPILSSLQLDWSLDVIRSVYSTVKPCAS